MSARRSTPTSRRSSTGASSRAPASRAIPRSWRTWSLASRTRRARRRSASTSCAACRATPSPATRTWGPTKAGASAATSARRTSRAKARTCSTCSLSPPLPASTAGRTANGDAPPRLHAHRAAGGPVHRRHAADARPAALLLERRQVEGSGAQGEPQPDARRHLALLRRQGKVSRVARRSRRGALSAKGAARSDRRKHLELADRAARGPAEGRRLRREKRRPGQEPGRQRVLAMVSFRQRGFTYLTVLFIVAILMGGLALVGEVWDTWAKRDRKSTRLNSSHSQISYAV